MSATSVSAPSSGSGSEWLSGVAGTEEVSCRGVVLGMVGLGLGWLFVAVWVGLLAGLKFHSPQFLADAAWLSYGRLQPVFWNALLYGFAWQAGLGVGLWLLVRLGEVSLSWRWAAGTGVVLWNVGLLVGVWGILAGDSTGHPWLELPGYSSLLLLAGYALVAVSALSTFGRRRVFELHPSQWFLLAALFWFPWVYSTAQLLLVADPVRGLMQSVVAWWYGGQYSWGCLAFLGLAVAWYFLPALLEQPLRGRYYALFAFWLLVLFTGWRGIPVSAPVPAWMPSVSTVFAVFSLVPWLAIALHWHQMLAGNYGRIWRRPGLELAVGSALAGLVAVALGILQALPSVARVTDLTLFTLGVRGLFVYGFVGGMLLAAGMQVVARLTPEAARGWPRACWPARLYMAGVWCHGLPLVFGGWAQGRALNDAARSWTEAFAPALMALRLTSLGDLLLVVAVAVYALGFGRVLLRWLWLGLRPVLNEVWKAEPAEVGS